MNDFALVLVPAAVALVMGFLIRGSTEPPATTSDGALILRYARVMRGFLVFASFATAMSAGLCLALAFADSTALWGRVVAAVGVIPLGWASIYLWRERDTTVLVDEIGVHVHDWRRRHRSIAWADLSDLKYSTGNHWWKLVGRDGQVVRVSSLLQGATEIPTRIRHHVSAPRWRRWNSVIERYQKARKQLDGLR